MSVLRNTTPHSLLERDRYNKIHRPTTSGCRRHTSTTYLSTSPGSVPATGAFRPLTVADRSPSPYSAPFRCGREDGQKTGRCLSGWGPRRRAERQQRCPVSALPHHYTCHAPAFRPSCPHWTDPWRGVGAIAGCIETHCHLPVVVRSQLSSCVIAVTGL